MHSNISELHKPPQAPTKSYGRCFIMFISEQVALSEEGESLSF